MTLAFEAHKIERDKFKPISKHIIVSDMAFEERISTGGIILLNDDKKSAGIRPRWAKVYAVGPAQTHIKVGEYVLVSHGRWTRGLLVEDETGEKIIRKVDPKDILATSDEPVFDETMSDKVI